MMYVVDGASRIIYYPSNYTNYLWSGQTLKRGDRNDDVRTLQSWLYRAGFNPGGIDGVYGANTEKAVKEFQKKVGITADGIAGKQTYQALQKYVRTETTTSQSNSSISNDHWTGQTLREGNRGQAVKDLQTKLQRLGYNVGAIDGIYGKQTAEAVKRFQKAHGLTVDGLAGKSTYRAIEQDIQQKNYYNQKTIIQNKYKALENKVHSKDSTWGEVVKSLKEIAKLGFDFIIGDDIKTLLDPNANTIDKVIAALSFIPGGKIVNGEIKLAKLGSKIEVKFDQKFLSEISKTKPINLPSYKAISIDMEHILSGHIKSGNRAKQSGKKDLFPENMTTKQIEKAIIEAYKNGKKLKSQGDRVKIEGYGGGMKIEMWVNLKTKIIETAYPKF